MYMLKMALELAHHDLVYEDVASKFFEHFGETTCYINFLLLVRIADAMNSVGGTGLWNEESGFYYGT